MEKPADIIELALPALRERMDIAAAYLLGSAVGGGLRADSDIDIALLPAVGRRLSGQSRLELAAQWAHALGRKVDVGVIGSNHPVYACEAILKGRRFFTADADQVAATETRLLGCYLTLLEDRKEVEEAYCVA